LFADSTEKPAQAAPQQPIPAIRNLHNNAVTRTPRHGPRLEEPPAGLRTAPSIRRLDPPVAAASLLAASAAAQPRPAKGSNGREQWQGRHARSLQFRDFSIFQGAVL